MTGKSAIRRQPLQLESLEKRDLCAGNVSVTVSDGDLHILGDAHANNIEIRPVSPGVVRVYGDFWAGQPTKINGVPNGSVTVRGVRDDFFISLNGGADRIDISGWHDKLLTVPDRLYLSSGSGDDFLRMNFLNTGDIDVYTGTGKDEVFVNSVTCRDDIHVEDPAALNRGDFDRVSINASTVQDQIRMISGSGNDSLAISASRCDDVYARLGAGNDSFHLSLTDLTGFFSVHGEGGTDTFFAPKYKNRTFRGVGFERVTNG